MGIICNKPKIFADTVYSITNIPHVTYNLKNTQ